MVAGIRITEKYQEVKVGSPASHDTRAGRSRRLCEGGTPELNCHSHSIHRIQKTNSPINFDLWAYNAIPAVFIAHIPRLLTSLNGYLLGIIITIPAPPNSIKTHTIASFALSSSSET